MSSRITRMSSCGTIGLPSELACVRCKPSIEKATLSNKKPRYIKTCRKPFDNKFNDTKWHGKKKEFEKINEYISLNGSTATSPPASGPHQRYPRQSRQSLKEISRPDDSDLSLDDPSPEKISRADDSDINLNLSLEKTPAPMIVTMSLMIDLFKKSPAPMIVTSPLMVHLQKKSPAPMIVTSFLKIAIIHLLRNSPNPMKVKSPSLLYVIIHLLRNASAPMKETLHIFY